MICQWPGKVQTYSYSPGSAGAVMRMVSFWLASTIRVAPSTSGSLSGT